jgi:hypothetical protein
MPSKRTRVGRHLAQRLTPQALDAYRNRDFFALHMALSLRPWHRSPLPISECELGVDQGEPPEPAGRPGIPNPWRESWYAARELQAEFEAVISETADKSQ